MPTHDDKSLDETKIRSIVVTEPNDMQKVIALRAVAFIAGQDCPYTEEFDGNDMAGATHILTLYGDEPVGTMRLRWFRDFVKVERACVSPLFRSNKIMASLSVFGKKLCANKGYERIIIHAQKRLKSYWEQNGFFVREGREPFIFSDYEYIEMESIVGSNDAIHIDTHPMILNRKEGHWQDVGILEQSQQRGVADTHQSLS